MNLIHHPYIKYFSNNNNYNYLILALYSLKTAPIFELITIAYNLIKLRTRAVSISVLTFIYLFIHTHSHTLHSN